MARYKDMIPYIVFGVLTTLINMVAYWLLAHLLKCCLLYTAEMWSDAKYDHGMDFGSFVCVFYKQAVGFS